jgi:D-alanyl-lipoteichoic acid acyltransferase DltB (MBOAT superfamily)
MGQFGFDPPERYRAPLLASSPLDFWRRWNTYVGGWMQRYVFWPASLHLARRRSVALSFMPRAAGVLATFGFVGALHDLSGYFVTTGFFGRSLVVFAVSGALVLVWEAASRLRRALVPSAGEGPLGRVAFGVASRLAFWATTVGLFHWWTT